MQETLRFIDDDVELSCNHPHIQPPRGRSGHLIRKFPYGKGCDCCENEVEDLVKAASCSAAIMFQWEHFYTKEIAFTMCCNFCPIETKYCKSEEAAITRYKRLVAVKKRMLSKYGKTWWYYLGETP